MVQLTGTSTTPLGVPNAEEKIRFTCVSSSGGVHRGIKGVVVTSATGTYSSSLVPGIYKVEVQQANMFEWMDNGTVEVTPTTPSPITLVQLVNDHQYVPPVSDTAGNPQ